MSYDSSSFTRIDYTQVGLTSKNTLKLIRKLSPQVFEVAIGDHTGSLHYFSIRADTNQIETIFKTLPGPNAKINCVDAYSGLKMGGSAKILIVYGPSIIKGFNKKGKQFFALELNNLTEPIKMFRMHRSPDEIHVVGQYIYNSYLVNTELVASGRTSTSSNTIIPAKVPSGSASVTTYNSVVRSRHYYVCPAQINDFVLMEDRFNRKIVPVLACQDRLLRVLKDSQCHFEVEVCGIPSVIKIVPKHLDVRMADANNDHGFNDTDWINSLDYDINRRKTSRASSLDSDINICYGTMDGKISLVTFQFKGKDQLEPLHHWEVPLDTIKQPITCLCFSESQPEFYVGRSDGSIEIWRLNESIQEGDVEQQVDLTGPPIMVESFNCSESITNLVPVLVGERGDLLLLCCTFTGLIFGLLQHGQAAQLRQLNPNYLMISKENADRIRSLQEECRKFEKQLENERKQYAKHTSSSSTSMFQSASTPASAYNYEEASDNYMNLSVLPFFAINDSFVLHNDASYILMLEVEVSIDVVVLHCDLPLDLIDCERNSAVISFNDRSLVTGAEDEMLVTFRCQTNTNRLEIRLRPVEGQHGTITVYVISRITPKSCQTRTYQIQPLSLHKRQYSNTRIEHPNTLIITGSFGINDAHTWLRLCIPEIPEKLSRTISDVESEVFYYASTLTRSLLICNCGRGIITMTSDNVSTISILKDFITREATKQSLEIGIEVDLVDKSLAIMLTRLFPKISELVRLKHRQDFSRTLADLQSTDADIAMRLLADLDLADLPQEDSVKPESKDLNDDDPSTSDMEHRRDNVQIGLDRLYGIITDLFIDYHKLKNSSIIQSLMAMAQKKLPEMIEMIESIILDSFESTIDYKEFPDTNTNINHYPKEVSVMNDMKELEMITPDDHSDAAIESEISEKTSKIIPPLTDEPHINLFIDRLFHFWNVTV